ncbi:type II toxin-antitoxin system Phd/YefM family antitoxin [Aerococcus sp. UMB1112A]|uniref:type II toxin-antitoxin system Phd/YefM family antitoxin n=1 Tax=Aerococcus sp. UMB1112A TaxID=3050609 RepID=UPI00254FD645|nr:type II toxin-antitoxin system Phd/YefM family antitoxin [Aerococcus sp. UMB1112A]MDK8502438.1 type II toxin-antitoxin system Phd/YefM family antitoxin [Aerococcus sp. UMB1112A]
MESIDFNNFRRNLQEYMADINTNSKIYIVTSTNGNEIIVMAESDFNSLMETCHLLSSRANRENLYQAIDELDRGDYELEEI